MDWWSEVEVYGPGFWTATLLVLMLTLLIISVSWVCGLAAALGKLSKVTVIRAVSDFYVWFIRGTPTLIQVFIVYFGLPQFGLRLSPSWQALLRLESIAEPMWRRSFALGCPQYPKARWNHRSRWV